MISPSLLETILNYLATKPYREVSGFIQAAQQEIAKQQSTQPPAQPAQSEEKGED